MRTFPEFEPIITFPASGGATSSSTRSRRGYPFVERACSTDASLPTRHQNRLVALSNDPTSGAIAALRRHRALQAEEKLAAGGAYTDAGTVFADEIGRPLTPSTVSSTFARHVREAELPRLTLHGLRHTFATLGLEAGIDTVYVSELLGHASPAITMQVYQRTRQERLAAAMDRVGDVIFGG
jgi:site-specific recombinase XerD